MVDKRPFQYAVLASLALHALVLFAFPSVFDPVWRAVQSAPPLLARLMEPEPVAPPKVEKPAPKPKAAKPAPERIAGPQALPAPDPEPSAPQPSAEPVPAPPPLAVARPAPVPAAPSAQEATDQLADQYRLQVIAAARRIKEHKRYPPQAWENRWEGDVVLGVSIRANGKTSVVVNRSSQYEVLDKQAVQIVAQALHEVPVPPALRGKNSVLKDVTVQYRQTD